MSKENPHYLVHFYCQNRFGEKYNIGTVKVKHKEKNGKIYVLFNSRFYRVKRYAYTLNQIKVNGELFNVSYIDY